MEPRKRIAVGSALASLGGVTLVIVVLLGDSTLAVSWISVVSFVAGVAAGVGSTLAVSGFFVCKRATGLPS